MISEVGVSGSGLEWESKGVAERGLRFRSSSFTSAPGDVVHFFVFSVCVTKSRPLNPLRSSPFPDLHSGVRH